MRDFASRSSRSLFISSSILGYARHSAEASMGAGKACGSSGSNSSGTSSLIWTG